MRNITVNSGDYKDLRELLDEHLGYTLISYPGGKRFKIIDKDGSTVLYAESQIVVAFAVNQLARHGVDVTQFD